MVHHNPDEKDKPSGITDTKALLELLQAHKQVKVLVFGHTHVWSHTEKDGLHMVNLPPTAYVFKEGLPSGWTDLRLRDDGATFQLHALKEDHPANKQKFELKWRA